LQTLSDDGVTSTLSADERCKKYVSLSTQALIEFGDSPKSGAEVFTTVTEALAEEIGLMLDEQVVASVKDIDLCLFLGTGWPFHRGGISPYLDQLGVSQTVNGKPFHP